MLFELIAAIVAGFAGAGVALLANKLLGGRLPRWLTLALAGLAMLSMAITNEYGWYPRTVQGLPEGLEIATTAEDRAIYRPWTYIVPFVTRFLAVDTATMRTNEAVPGQRIVDVYAFARWAAPRRQGVAVDCSVGRRADLGPGVAMDADGGLQGADWREVGPDDPIVRTACRA